MGFTYFVTKWFRYLKVFILEQTAQIESKEGVLQLEHIPVSGTKIDIDGLLPHANGNWVDQRGIRWEADVSVLDLHESLDVVERSEK